MKNVVFYLLFLCLCLTLAKKRKIEKHKPVDECQFCKHEFEKFIKIVRKGGSDQMLMKAMKFFCTMHSYKDKQVCHDAIESYYPTIKFMIENTPNITSNKICHIYLQPHSCDYHLETLELWNVRIHPGGPKAIKAKSDIPKGSKNNLKILQITDIHYDPVYKTGANAKCLQPVCCREITNSTLSQYKAGKWGSYDYCDMPLDTFESSLAHIKKTHKKIDIIYVTGDYADHADWRSSWEHNFMAISTIFKMLIEAFPHIPMYPLIGNHEPNPMNVFAPSTIKYSNISTQPLYEFMVKEWNWLPQQAKDTIMSGGYYTVLIRPGLRLIAINNNICLVQNWWLIYESSYPIQLLEWLENKLYDAERNKEKVHILAHIPSGNQHCYKEWARQYNKIIERYYDTISGQFNGHTHRDQFNIHFAEYQPFIPLNVVWNGGSISTWAHANPNYRMYSVEPETFQVTNHETWIFNLTEANSNETSSPRWFSEYKFRDAYKIPNLSPASLYNLVEKLAENITMLNEYHRYYAKQGDPSLKMGCNINCYKYLLCSIVGTEFLDSNPRCVHLMNVLDKTLQKKKYF